MPVQRTPPQGAGSVSVWKGGSDLYGKVGVDLCGSTPTWASPSRRAARSLGGQQWRCMGARQRPPAGTTHRTRASRRGARPLYPATACPDRAASSKQRPDLSRSTSAYVSAQLCYAEYQVLLSTLNTQPDGPACGSVATLERARSEHGRTGHSRRLLRASNSLPKVYTPSAGKRGVLISGVLTHGSIGRKDASALAQPLRRNTEYS